MFLCKRLLAQVITLVCKIQDLFLDSLVMNQLDNKESVLKIIKEIIWPHRIFVEKFFIMKRIKKQISKDRELKPVARTV